MGIRETAAIWSVVLLTAAACTEIRNNVDAVVPAADAGSHPGGDAGDAVDATLDAGPTSFDAADVDDAVDVAQDAGNDPTDFACPEPWTTASPTRPGCEKRGIVTIEPGVVIDSDALAIAVTGAGRVGIAYNSKLTADQGEIHLVRFMPPAAPPLFDAGLDPVPVGAVIAGTDFENIGFVLDMAAGAEDKFHLAYQTSSDDIRYASASAVGQASADETVATGIGPPSEIALSVLPNGDLRATYQDPGLAKMLSTARPVAGIWESPSIVRDGFLESSGMAGVGHVAQVVDALGSVHVAYDYARVASISEPCYAQLAGTEWTVSKTLENIGLVSQGGFGIALAITGQTRHAAYFVVHDGNDGADLRVASWAGPDETPSIEILDQGIAAGPTPHYRLAMASDHWGLLHIALVRPGADASLPGELVYFRQQRIANDVTWLSDVVDPNVYAVGGQQSLVDIAVDGSGRPHIAYYRGTDLSVRYATRWDR